MSQVIGALLLIVGFFFGIPIGVSLEINVEINGKISETQFWQKLSNVTAIILKTVESLRESIIPIKTQ